MVRVLRIALVVVLSVFFPLLATAGDKGDSRADEARAEHQRIVEFWTPERVAQAIPREFVADPATGRFRQVHHRPGHGGGPGGGDGGSNGDETVTGSSWDGGGVVVETTGKVLFSLSGRFFVCSASVVEDSVENYSLVLTAAHCVYDNEGSGEFAENWMFIPNYDASPVPLTTTGSFCAGTEHGCWTATALVLHDGFASAGGFNLNAIVHDFAFAVLGPGGHSENVLVESLGTQDIAFTNISKGTQVFAFGYPHASPYDGTDLVYCAGGADFDNRLANLTYKLRCDMTGGSSGGPWYRTFDTTTGQGTAISVNSYRYIGGNAMYGPKFNSNTQAVYSTANTTDQNTIVGG
jgi:V8-like Glu-specific endopeptidase